MSSIVECISNNKKIQCRVYEEHVGFIKEEKAERSVSHCLNVETQQGGIFKTMLGFDDCLYFYKRYIDRSGGNR